MKKKLGKDDKNKQKLCFNCTRWDTCKNTIKRCIMLKNYFYLASSLAPYTFSESLWGCESSIIVPSLPVLPHDIYYKYHCDEFMYLDLWYTFKGLDRLK